jgi:YHS domain-containing protein
MKKEFVKCDFCSAEVSAEQCQLANLRTVIDGKEYVFCCTPCAQKFQAKIEKKKKK